MTILTTNTFYTTMPLPQTPTPTSITMVEPISYEFQVVEYMEGDRIAKVALQVKRNTHDQFGSIKLAGSWQEVPRIQMKL